jgi:hypothetical protein
MSAVIEHRAPAVSGVAVSRGAIGFLFGYACAMGWLEAVVVVYIRGLVGLPHAGLVPPPDQVMGALRTVPWLVSTEQTREAATLVMLVAVAGLTGRTPRQRLGAFLASFGTWDIVYYIGLYVLLGWPPSLMTRDVLFLIPPHPWWYQPVWVPIAISCLMIAWGVTQMRSR